jgi:hypothetical protein
MNINVLLIQPHPMRFKLGGKRSPTNRSGTIYNIMNEAGFNITVGTKISSTDIEFANKLNLKYELITQSTNFDKYDRIVLLSGTFNYCFPPTEEFDDKKRCLQTLKMTKCPVIFIQDEYITKYTGYPAYIQCIKRLWEKGQFNELDNLIKDREVKILMQCKYPKELAVEIEDKMNCYSSLKNYKFINWGVQRFAFDFLMKEPIREPKHILSYIGVMRPDRSRLNLINNKRTNIFGRWKYPLDKAHTFPKGINVTDVPNVLNNSIATIWTHDDNFKGMSVESARLYEAVRCGTVLLIDEVMLKSKDDCYLSGINCFYSTKKELWEKVARLKKNLDYRLKLIEAQQNRLYNTVNSTKLKQEFISFFN